MKWFEGFLNKPIIKIFRIDTEVDYDFFRPMAVFIDVGAETGLFIGAINDGTSIRVEASNLDQVSDEYGLEYREAVLNEILPDDELTKFIGHGIKSITVGVYNTEDIRGENFIVKLGKYAGVIIETPGNNFTYYNQLGGYLIVDDDAEFPNPQRWTMVSAGC